MKKMIPKIKGIKILHCVIIILMLMSFKGMTVSAAEGGDTPVPFSFNISVNDAEDGKDVVSSIQILVILTLIAMAPSILVMLTSFTRIIIVLHFLRSAIGTQTSPPNQVLIGLALFLTFFIMSPTITQINAQALEPYSAGTITQQEAIDNGLEPLREFMFKQTQEKDILLFMDIAKIEPQATNPDAPFANIPTEVLIPAFMISELRAAFIIGFLLYLPFLIIDMVVASALMSMGMMMLPPVMISMPFKILLFVLVDGWGLLIGNLVKSFNIG